MVIRLPLALAVWMMAVRAVLAADAAAVAAPLAAGPVATAVNDATSAQIDAWLADDDPRPNAGDPLASSAVQGAPRAVHGEATVAVGSGGYRAASVAALVPVGETGTLGVALADERYGDRRGGGEHRALDVDLMLGAGLPQEPCGLRHTGPQLLGDAARLQRCGDASPWSAP